MIVTILTNDHRSYGSEATRFDIYVLVEIFKAGLVQSASWDVQHVVENDGIRAYGTNVFLGAFVTMATGAYLTVKMTSADVSTVFKVYVT